MASAGMLSAYMQRIAENHDAQDVLKDSSTYLPFFVCGEHVGYCHHKFVQCLKPYSEVFEVTSESISVHHSLKTPEERTAAVGKVMQEVRFHAQEEAVVGALKRWRGELYSVARSFSSPPLMGIERAAASLFGLKTYGVHINGYVENDDGSLSMWVGKRSLTKPEWPGLLDQMVAGGMPQGIPPQENVIKECMEEAGMGADLARKARPVSAISYQGIGGNGLGLRRAVQLIYDIKLPKDFVPQNTDGEVESFKLLPIQEVMRLVRETLEFKPNCNVVIIDFLVRHGILTPEMPGYLELVKALRQGEMS